MANLHTLKPTTKRTTSVRVGRGGKRGKTSGRGTKGQKARAGNKKRPEMRDIIKKIPKLRGHGKNRARTVNDARIVYAPVNLSTLEALFNAGDEVNPQTLFEREVIRKRGGKLAPVKILAHGELKKKLTISGCKLSKTAQEAVEKAGGEIK